LHSIVVCLAREHPKKSSTIKEYVPPVNPVTVISCGLLGMLLLQVKSNGPVPWVINAVIVPWLPLPHDVEYKEKSTAGVEVMENGVEMVQPSASITDKRC
jgi:hypothetical protein